MIVFTPMTDAEFAVYLDCAVRDYAQDKVASGQWSAEASMALSHRDYADLLPNGLATPDHVLYTLRDATTHDNVGMLWYAIQQRADERIAYVYDFLIESPYRRRGHASEALQALETEVATRGLSGIALHVFGHNAQARALYAKLGYLPTNINLFKSVAAAQPRSAGAPQKEWLPKTE